MKARFFLSFPGLVIAAMCLTPALHCEETPSVNETLSIRYVSVHGVLAVLGALASDTVAEDLSKVGKPIAATVGRTRINADPIANSLTFSGPADEVQRLKEQAAALDRKPEQIILCFSIGQWRLLQNGIPKDCAIGQFALSEVDLAKVRVDRNGRLKPLDWSLEKVSLSNALSILGSTERFRVLSQPTIFTLSNVPATASLPPGSVWIPQGNLLQPADLSLQVLPKLQANGTIELEIDFSPVPQGQPVPIPVRGQGQGRSILRTDPFKITIQVPNRRTVYLGGIFLESPDAPPGAAMEWPFKGRLVELPIFIQPTIVESREQVGGGE
jgi:hypothetical protein